MGPDSKLGGAKERIVTADADRYLSREGKIISERAADETLRLVEEHGSNVGVLTPESEKKLKRKIYVHVLLLVIIIDLMLYASDFARIFVCGLLMGLTNSLLTG